MCIDQTRQLLGWFDLNCIIDITFNSLVFIMQSIKKLKMLDRLIDISLIWTNVYAKVSNTKLSATNLSPFSNNPEGEVWKIVQLTGPWFQPRQVATNIKRF